jgi:hypothetical protein
MFACAAMFGAVLATAQTPAIITATAPGNTGAAPIGIAATTSELLFTQPFCAGFQTRGIYSSDVVSTSALLSAIPEEGTCAENYLAISPGLGGFTAGDTFVTGVSTINPANTEVFKNGSIKFIEPIPNSKDHAGITFDAAGTFGFALIVTAEGSVTGYDSTGTAQFTYPTPVGTDYVLEGAAVAPLTYGPCPGCLYVTAVLASNVDNSHPSGDGAIFFVNPGTVTGTPMTLWSTTPGVVEPEGLVFVENNLSCSLAGAHGAAYSYFVSGYATGSQEDNPLATNGAILAYTPAQLAPFAGQILVPDELGKIVAFSGPGVSTTFSDTGYQLEGSTIVSCPSGGTGCPATFGFWKHHPFPPSMFVGGTTSIGCMNYSAATLVAILNTNAGGGNAVIILAHQLIAAIANYDAGGTQTPAATAAIGSALALLCANHINMSTSFVQAGTTLGQQMTALANVLDTYNSSAPSCEGSGLASVRRAPTADAIASSVRIYLTRSTWN